MVAAIVHVLAKAALPIVLSILEYLGYPRRSRRYLDELDQDVAQRDIYCRGGIIQRPRPLSGVQRTSQSEVIAKQFGFWDVPSANLPFTYNYVAALFIRSTMVDAHIDNGPASDPHRDNPVGTTVGPRPSSSFCTSTASYHSSSHDDSNDSNDSNELDPDNLELHEIETQHDDDSTASISSGEYRITTRRTVSRTSQGSRARREGVIGFIQRFWMRNVSLTVPQKKNRDYFALERTFLAYIRTSVILAMQGVLIAQLFRLQSANSTKGLGYHEVGVPLSIACHCAAMLTAILGALRFWKQQSAIALGTVYAGGWELNCIGLLTTAITIVTFILSILVAVTIS
ncbi:hypothetical protein BJY00DRAFT_312229 [Aspergillus carlsbadensis]|nr:hypothetical protein BJY00DRAFT_312229 [Aspergillus carlsbadensis]